MVRFIHAADIHLDSPLRGLERYEGAPSDRIRSAARRALERLVDLAIERKVDFVLIAGDLYDGDWRDYNTGLFLVKALGRLGEAKIPSFVIAGNHDAGNTMTRSLRLPEGVRMLATDRPETARLDGIDVAIHGQGFAEAAVRHDLSAAYPHPIKGCLNVGMLHTCVAGAEGHERYAPCSVDALRGKGYDYWALGHVHRRQAVCDDPPIAFPGNLQGRHARELGPKGCLLVEAEPGRPARSEFHRLDVLRWESCDLDASGLDHPDDLIEAIRDELNGALSGEEDEGRLLAVRLTFSGSTSLHHRIISQTEYWLNEVRNQAIMLAGGRLWVERVRFRTGPPRRSTDVGRLDGPLGTLHSLIAEARSRPDELATLAGGLEELKRKLRPLLPDLARGAEPFDPDDPEWLATILGRVEPLLVHHLHLDEGGEGEPNR